MIRKALVIATLCFLSIRTETAEAQLSQLDFDKPGGTVTKEARAGEAWSRAALIEAVLTGEGRGMLAVPRAAKVPEPVSPPRTAAPVTEAIEITFNSNDSSLERQKRQFAPRLQGPLHDTDGHSLITSRYRWKAGDDGKCENPTDKGSIKSKANALKEILSRFNGTNDVYNGFVEEYCAPRCAPQASRLLGLELQDGSGASLLMTKSYNQCRYRLSKPSNSDWQQVEASKVVCACNSK